MHAVVLLGLKVYFMQKNEEVCSSVVTIYESYYLVNCRSCCWHPETKVFSNKSWIRDVWTILQSLYMSFFWAGHVRWGRVQRSQEQYPWSCLLSFKLQWGVKPSQATHGYICEASNFNINIYIYIYIYIFFFVKFITFVRVVTSREFTNSCKLWCTDGT